MTVFVYVNTSKQVSDADHIKVFGVDAAKVVRGQRRRRGGVRIRGSGVNRIGRCTIVCMVLLLALAVVWNLLR